MIKSIFAFILIIAISGLCILNRTHVELVWSPVHPAYLIPLYLVILLSISIGFFLGAVMTWVNQAPLRKKNKDNKKTIKALEKKIEELPDPANTNQTDKAEKTSLSLPAPKKPFSDFFPALPHKKDT